MTLVELKKDLFSMKDNRALAHCVGADFIMGAGIAREFKKRYDNVEWLLEHSRGVGTALLLSLDRDIFYLVTKRRSRYDKPTYQAIEAAIKDMFSQAVERGITKIAMPKIGCGLDGKKWDVVRGLLEKHQPETIDITVCKL